MAKHPECLGPVDVLIAAFGSFRPSKYSDDVWRSGDCIGYTSVSENRGISRDHVNAVDHAAEAHRLEDLGGAKGLNVCAHGHDDETKCSHEGHDQETLLHGQTRRESLRLVGTQRRT